MANKANLNPDVLKWARESARISVERAAEKITIPTVKLLEWEQGLSQPTIRQAETLAHFYRRPFALFFLPEVPNDFLPLQDFRRTCAQDLSTASIFIIREMQQKHSWLSEMNEEDGAAPLDFVGKFSLKDSPQRVADHLLDTLGINPLKYSSSPIKEWIEQAERAGIFVSRSSFIHSRLKLDREEIQGFAIADQYSPFIFINSQDWVAPQLFTLVHELAHIWIAESGISNEIDVPLKSRDPYHPVELFCNEVAACALIPPSLLQKIEMATFTTSATVFKFAKTIGVSSYALLLRALNMGMISLKTYKLLKSQTDKDFISYQLQEQEKRAKLKSRSGGPNPYLIRLHKNGKLFTQTVLDAFRAGRIAATQASSMLNTQVNNFNKLESFLYT